MKAAVTAFVAAALLTAPVMAETLKAVPGQLDPTKAYVLVEYRQQRNTFAPGFPGSSKWVPLLSGLVLGRYDLERSDVRGLGRAADRPLPAKQRAVEPFRDREIAKADGARLMMLELEPDTWVVQGWGNTSFSLGSYSFRLKPGTVTDLGVVTSEADWPEGEQPRPAGVGSIAKLALLGPFAKRPAVAPARLSFRPRESGDIAVPASLVASTVRVSFTPGARFGNYLGGLVNRIEGVNRGEAKALPISSRADATTGNTH